MFPINSNVWVIRTNFCLFFLLYELPRLHYKEVFVSKFAVQHYYGHTAFSFRLLVSFALSASFEPASFTWYLGQIILICQLF